MIKLPKLTVIIFTLIFTGITAVGYAQDTVKKTRPVVVKPATGQASTLKPIVKQPATGAPPKYTAVKTAVTTAGQKPATTGITIVKPIPQYIPDNPALLNDKSLNGQYQYLLTKVYHYQQPLIMALWKNYSDTLSATRRKLTEASTKLKLQTQKADSLLADITAKDQTLSTSNAKADSVSLLGMPLTKATYNWIMWGLVVGFGAIAIVVIASSGAHRREANYRTKLYNELEEDYKTYKAKANEKEKKLARELQTERNKLDELLGKG
ncbi:hypothetical protein [Mucilaginibacter psychrotolerans]|uniref:tRNA (Guanine-N1)-methyltransferase n=1 Tax=Mucilaginibacter psychrotolerans TaxID=1524096 RepID=A0A4Y8S5J7_9SPHI|nr:hypothetical protein [Mucilaginibacter psychrotolerans]TFF33820.1 hypothetical protein E2R66_24115 [Mucilaginibacter psychrotolerans]